MERFAFGRIPSLDGLRTVSIILVITGHFLHVLGVGHIGNLGNLGVRIFFVISGFLITGLLLKEIDKTNKIDLIKFYFRRTLRIFPPYYFYLLIVFVIGWVLIPLSSFLVAGIYATNFVNPENWYLGHTWSLSVEEQFYLIFPGLLLFLGLPRSKYLLTFIIFISPFIRVFLFKTFGANSMWVDKGFQSNMDALAIGCLLSIFYQELHSNQRYLQFLKSKTVVIFPIIILAFNVQTEHPIIYYGVSISVMNILIALCLDWVVTNYDSAVGKILNSVPMVTLGGMSYSIYLWQQPFFNPDNPGILTQTPFNFAGLIVMTLISYYFVEKYSLKLRQILENKFFAKNSLNKNEDLVCQPSAR